MNATPFARGWTKPFEQIPIAPLVQIRLALGLILLWESYRYISKGWARGLFLEPPFLFKYYGFGWVHPLPETWHLAVFPALAVLAVMLTVGLFYRLCAFLLCLGWGYVFLLDQALYLNHLYLVVMVTGLMVLLPAHRAFSLDCLWRPRLSSTTVPRWTIDLLRFQVAVVYIFGGIAKLNFDWLSGVPMQMMLLDNTHLFGGWTGQPLLALFFAYGGLFLDLGIVPLLCWRRTRLLALAMATVFHIMNHILFQIGIFPWTMLAATFILWPPFRLSMLNFARLYGGLVLAGMIITVVFHPPGRPGQPVEPWAWGVALVVSALLTFPPDSWKKFAFEADTPEDIKTASPNPFVCAFLILFAAYQIFMPLRHLLYPGDVSWTEEGHRWAWQMKLRVKVADRATFSIRDSAGEVLDTIDPFSPTSPLTPRQAHVMSTRPDMALEFAHYIAENARDDFDEPIQMTLDNPVSLNGRPFQRMIDPDVDLTTIDERLWPPAEWIEPLATPRRPLTRVRANQIRGLWDYIESGRTNSGNN